MERLVGVQTHEHHVPLCAQLREEREHEADVTVGDGELRLVEEVHERPVAASRLWALTLLSVAATLGALLLGLSLFWSDAAVRDIAERAGLSGAAGVLAAVAWPFTWLLRKVRGR